MKKFLTIVLLSFSFFVIYSFIINNTNTFAKSSAEYRIKVEGDTVPTKAVKKGSKLFIKITDANEILFDDLDMDNWFEKDDMKEMKIVLHSAPYYYVNVGSNYMKFKKNKIKLGAKVYKEKNNIYVPLDIITLINSRDKYTVDHTRKIINFYEVYYTSRKKGVLTRYRNASYGVKTQKEYDQVLKNIRLIKKSINNVPFNKYLQGYLKGERAPKYNKNFTNEQLEEYYGYKEAEAAIGNLVKVGLSDTQIKNLYRINEALDYFFDPEEFKYKDSNNYYTSYQSLYELLYSKKRSDYNELYFKEALLREYKSLRNRVERYIPAGITTNSNKNLEVRFELPKYYVKVFLQNHYFEVKTYKK